MREMPRPPDIGGCVVTADAMRTRKETAGQIVEQGGDHILPLKTNHPLAE